MSKKILTIGFELAPGENQYTPFESKMSLLDWDIIIFKPEIYSFVNTYSDFYQGKPSLSDSASFRLKECCEHWRREIKEATEAGKTVIIYLPRLYEVYVDTGQRSYSGTGRNQKTTRHVASYSNYQAIPVSLAPVAATGSSMKLAPKGAEVLAPYWSEFGSQSSYHVLLNSENIPTCLITRTGDKPVGAIFRSKLSSGTLLLLPDIDFYPDNFTKQKGDNRVWTPTASQFAGRFVSTIVALDKALRSTTEITPEPEWAGEEKFKLKTETTLRLQLLEAEKRVEEAQKHKENISEALSSAGAIRGLLYEKGKALENVIIESLRILGFKAASYKDSESEFDVVFESIEGRLIGEAEGKDSKAINIDKLRQLSMNIHEDLQREEVSSPAKPVLFGNGYRLQSLHERSDPFTEKCHSAAATANTALVFTPDLFTPTQYILDHNDGEYANLCRQAILTTTGRVSFPSPPSKDYLEEKIEDSAED